MSLDEQHGGGGRFVVAQAGHLNFTQKVPRLEEVARLDVPFHKASLRHRRHQLWHRYFYMLRKPRRKPPRRRLAHEITLHNSCRMLRTPRSLVWCDAHALPVALLLDCRLKPERTRRSQCSLSS